MKTINPATGKLIKIYPQHSSEEIGERVELTKRAFRDWRKLPLGNRFEFIRKVGLVLKSKSSDLAKLMANEMGKPIQQGISEMEKCAWVCDYYTDKAPEFLKDVYVDTDAAQSFYSPQPMGTVLGIMPWNFPFWQVFRFAIPNLIAGNTVILKHSENVAGCAMEIEKVFIDAGCPEHIFQNLRVSHDDIEELIAQDSITGVTLTGSTRAGSTVASLAGKHLKKTVLELGGSDPYLIFSDADIELSAQLCAKSRLINSGQSCIAAKRFIVHQSVADEFSRKVLEEMKAMRIGDPLNQDTDIGPLAREDLKEELEKQVKESEEKGAKCQYYQNELPDSGFYFPPTVLTEVKPGMPAFDEELFGPVASIITVESDDEAVDLANQSQYGLGAAIFSKNTKQAVDIARNDLEAGFVAINTFVKSDPRLPFGGIKKSGYGRELSEAGIKEFLNLKTIVVD